MVPDITDLIQHILLTLRIKKFFDLKPDIRQLTLISHQTFEK